MNLNEWYEKGMTPDSYIESMETHKDNLMHIYDHLQMPDDKVFFDNIQNQNLRVIVLTEDWCGDAMLNIPVLLRLTDQTATPVKMLPRDQNLDLMDQYLTNGKSRSIPIFIFIDEMGIEVAKWGPRAEKVQEFVDDANEKLPDKDTADFRKKQKEMLLFITKSFRENPDFWMEVYTSLKQKLQNATNAG